MFIAHLPTGYIAAKLIFNRVRLKRLSFKPVLTASLLGSVAPDFDLVYFYLIDNRQHNHHSYWTHYPFIWATMLAASLLWTHLSKSAKPYSLWMAMFSFSGLIHMLLDTIVGGIWWLAPFSNTSFSFFPITGTYRIWWLNFALHWTFILELALLTWAIVLWRRNARKTMLARPEKYLLIL